MLIAELVKGDPDDKPTDGLRNVHDFGSYALGMAVCPDFECGVDFETPSGEEPHSTEGHIARAGAHDLPGVASGNHFDLERD